MRCGLVLSMLVAAAGCRSTTESPPAAEHFVRVYVTNESSGDLSIIDANTATLVSTVRLGKRPRGIKPSPDGRSLYVALTGSPMGGPGVEKDALPPADRSADGIGEVDVDSGRLKRIIHAGVDPEQLDVSADGRTLYVANEDAAQLSVVDLESGAITATVKTGDEPEGVTIRPDGKVVYVTSEADGTVYAIDTATNTVLQRIEVGHRPRSIGFLPDGSRAFVTLENDGAVAVVDGQQHTFLRLIELDGQGHTPKPRPMGVLVQPDGRVVYVSTGSFGSVFFIDPAAERPTGSIPVGQRPWGIGLLPDGKTLYSANGPSNDVSVIDLPSRRVVKRIKVGERPWGVAVLKR